MINYRVTDGLTARGLDPQGLQWPEGSLVLFAEEDEQVVGRLAYLLLPHFEGAYVRPDKQGTSLALKLVKKMEEVVAGTGHSHVFAYAYDEQPEISGYLSRVGYSKLPLTVWIKKVAE